MHHPDLHNLFSGIPAFLPNELVTTIGASEKTRIERIVSKGHASPAGFWYDQEWDEWVLVVSGRAGVRFEDGKEVIEMRSGDHMVIPAHCRHRVEWTSDDEETVWVAVHFA